MIKVSHECPKCLLDESRHFNDYDYCLVHLTFEDEDYLNFYKESLEQGRIVYLDNSLFELREMFDHDKFADKVKELGTINPNNLYYIVPDVFDNADETIDSFKKFTKNYPNLPGKKMGVVQGTTFEELKKCYSFMKENADVVAMAFMCKGYLEIGEGKTLEEKFVDGRRKFLHIIDTSDVTIHLLGCFLPQEFTAYKDIPNIYSCDTSNPVVHGILGIKYNDYGLDKKEDIKIVDIFNCEIDKEQLDLIRYNINIFKTFCE